MALMTSLLILLLALINITNGQGYGDAPDPEPVPTPTVTTAPLLIDCNTPSAPQAIALPTLPPLQPIEFPTLPPPHKLPSFADLFTTAGYPSAPPSKGYDEVPPQLPTLAPPPKLPTFNELFPPVAPAKPDSYVQPKIDYVPAPVAPSASSYQTAPPMFTFAPPPPMPKFPTFAELFPPAPAAPITAQKPQGSYETGPPSVQPQNPYDNAPADREDEDDQEDMDGDEVLLQPAEEHPRYNYTKTHAKLDKLRRMHGVVNRPIIRGSPHHLHMHNAHQLHNHP